MGTRPDRVAIQHHHTALQRAHLSHWHAGATVLLCGGLSLCAGEVSPLELQPLFLAMLALFAVPYGLATGAMYLGRYRVAAAWSTMGALGAVVMLFIPMAC